jgi:cephalosporin-C deacetylase-like acetyl esterase
MEEINEKQIAVIGTSLGGFIAAISMGIDERISAGAFLLSGGNYESPVWLKEKRDSHMEAERCEAEKLYLQFLAEVAEKGFENVPPAKKSYLTDPMTFASNLRQRPVLMINALRDKYIPKQATLDFWQACGKPDIRWFPTGHASIWLLYPLIRKQIIDFLRFNF